jgi:hypothetical protein
MEISSKYIASSLLLNKLIYYGARIVRKFAVIQIFFLFVRVEVLTLRLYIISVRF